MNGECFLNIGIRRTLNRNKRGLYEGSFFLVWWVNLTPFIFQEEIIQYYYKLCAIIKQPISIKLKIFYMLTPIVFLLHRNVKKI